MKIVRTIAVGLVLVVIATATALYINPPLGWMMNQASQFVKQQTGRDLTVAGNKSLQLGWTTTLRLEDVTLGPASGSGAPSLKARAIEADFELLPLLARRLEIGRLRAETPEINIEPAPAATRSAAAPASGGAKPLYSIGEIAVSNAKVTFRDAPGATPQVIEAVSFQTDRVVAGAPVAASFDLMWRGEKVTGSTRINSIESLAQGGSSGVTVKLTTARGSLDAEGDAIVAGSPQFKGKGTGVTRSLRDMAKWIGQPLPDGKGFGEARATGDITVDAKRLQLSNARIVVDDTTATGGISVDLPPGRVKVSGKLAADRLDASRYVDGLPAPAATAVRRSRAPAFTIQQVPLKDSLKAYLAATDRGVQPEAAMMEASGIDVRRAGLTSDTWSDAPLFDAEVLKGVDADLEVAIKTLKIGPVEAAVPRLKIALNAGELMLDAPKIDTGNGGLGAAVRVDARQPVPALTGTIKLEDLDVRELFGEAGLETFVAGGVTGEGEFKATGRSQRELVRSLDGAIKADIDRGAVVGWDVWSVVKNFGRLGAFDESLRVPLDRARANVVIAKGVARSQAVEAGGPVLRLRGEATARLPSRDLDTQARVQLVSSLLSAIAIKIGGPWEDLKLTWGWDSVFGATRSDPVQSPVGVVEGLDLKDPELADLLRRSIERAKSTRAPNETAVDAMSQLLEKAEGK